LRVETVRAAVADLLALHLLEEKNYRGRAYYCPVFQESIYLKKKSFDPAKWWSGLHSRKVVKEPAPKSTNTIRKAVVKAFVVYANMSRRRINTAYLAKATGLLDRNVRRILKSYKVSGSIVDDAKLGLAWVDSVGSETFTVSEMNHKRLTDSLAKCWVPDVKQRLIDLGTKHPDLYWRIFKYVIDEDKRQKVTETRWTFIESLIIQKLPKAG